MAVVAVWVVRHLCGRCTSVALGMNASRALGRARMGDALEWGCESNALSGVMQEFCPNPYDHVDSKVNAVENKQLPEQLPEQLPVLA